MKKGTPPKSDPEIDALLGPLDDEEFAQLKRNIEEEGQREPGIVWKETGIRLDGRHRQMACAELGIEFRYITISLPDKQAALDWVWSNQLGRRNLSKADRDFLIAHRVRQLKKRKEEETAKQAKEEVQNAPLLPPKGPGSVNVVAQVAEQMNVSVDTVKRAAADSNFCAKCLKFGIQKGCEYCKKIKAEAKGSKPPKPPAAPKKGSELVDWKGLESAMGVVVRLSDRIVAAYPDEKKGMERGEYDRLTAVLVRKAQAWKKKLTGGGK